jgi:hypothetical protein
MSTLNSQTRTGPDDLVVDTAAKQRCHRKIPFVSIAVFVSLLTMAPAATAEKPPYHILSAQNLCNLAWPSSQAMPDPAKPVGTLCVRHGGVIERFANAAPNLFSNKLTLEPGSILQLPLGSVRINPDDPMSDWLIPDCHIPNRLDCTP